MTNDSQRNRLDPTITESFPSHWRTRPFWSVAKKKSVVNNENLDLLSVYLNKGVVRFEDVQEKRTNATSDDTSKYQKVEKGNLVLNNQQAWRGSVGVSSFDGIVSPAYIVLELSDDLDAGFSNYLFRDGYMVSHYLMSSKGVGSIQRNIFLPLLRTVPVPVPPRAEQRLMSCYLDKKTQQIDSLIDKIQKKIELLKEQRTSLINQCVTKGLDPSVKMKDSGVEWIGEIPSHWKVTRLKYVCPDGVQYGLNIDSDSYREKGIRFLRITDIQSNGSIKEQGIYLSKNDVPDGYYLYPNDILFSRSGGTVGKTTRISDEIEPMTFAGYLVRFSFSEEDVSTFIKWVTESSYYWSWIELQVIQSTIQNVNGEKYSNFSLCLPPPSEREEINEKLETVTGTVDQLISKNRKKISLLGEYRQSLISSVVTGKVRVTEDME